MSPRHDSEGGVVLERVRSQVHLATGRSGVPSTASAHEIEEPSPDAPAATGGARRALAPGDVVPVGAVALLALLSGDMLVSAMAGVTAGLAVVFRRLAEIGRFGFADGFVGYRPDPAWPRGVQEDDDFRWSWTPPEPSPSSGRRSATR